MIKNGYVGDLRDDGLHTPGIEGPKPFGGHDDELPDFFQAKHLPDRDGQGGQTTPQPLAVDPTDWFG